MAAAPAAAVRKRPRRRAVSERILTPTSGPSDGASARGDTVIPVFIIALMAHHHTPCSFRKRVLTRKTGHGMRIVTVAVYNRQAFTECLPIAPALLPKAVLKPLF